MRKKSNRFIAALILLLTVLTVIQWTVFILAVPGKAPTLAATGKVTGSSGSGTVSFFYIRQGICSIPLTQGWQLISLCANVTDPRISAVLYGIDYRYVMRWNELNQGFDIYSPRAATNPFTTMEYNTSYFVNLNAASATVTLQGINATDINITLVTGWNGPGFPYVFGTNITRYFNQTKHRYLMKWNASEQGFMIYSPRAAQPAFTTIAPPEGQLLNAFVNDVLVYNVSQLQS